jgi:hypothetical protein
MVKRTPVAIVKHGGADRAKLTASSTLSRTFEPIYTTDAMRAIQGREVSPCFRHPRIE